MIAWLVTAIVGLAVVGAVRWFRQRARAERARHLHLEQLRRRASFDADTDADTRDATAKTRARTEARLGRQPTPAEVRNTIDRVRGRPR